MAFRDRGVFMARTIIQSNWIAIAGAMMYPQRIIPLYGQIMMCSCRNIVDKLERKVKVKTLEHIAAQFEMNQIWFSAFQVRQNIYQKVERQKPMFWQGRVK